MKKILKQSSALLLASVIMLSSCSTLLQGSRQNITIQSLTPDSKILINGDDMGKDLVTTKLKRNKSHTIMIKKDGYETKTVSLEKQVQAGYIVVDALLAFTGFGLLWIIVDAATGSWHRFEKDKVVVELDKK